MRRRDEVAELRRAARRVRALAILHAREDLPPALRELALAAFVFVAAEERFAAEERAARRTERAGRELRKAGKGRGR